jgi:DNA repair protein SbcD/Mre11
MPAFSFVHAADLHLDSPFVGIGRLPEEQGQIVRALREATFEAFDAVIDLCLEREVDFLLVAGDVYDGADRSLRAQLRFRDGMQRLAERGIRAYVVHGNHDPLDGWSHALQMPETVHVFRDRLESVVFEKEGAAVARIHGISYPTREIEMDFGQGMRREGAEPFQIGLLHCNAGGNPRHDPYAPRSVAELIDAQLDYWALGHIHERQTLHSSEPFIGYPGNTQGRHINESGPRGCLRVTVGADGRLAETPEFVPTDRVRWEPVQFDIAGIESLDGLLDALEDRMETLLQESGRRPLVTRITLTGRGALHRELARPETLADVEAALRSRGAPWTPFIWLERLVSNTRPDLDLDSRRAGQDFLGDVLRLIDEVRGSPDELHGLSEAVQDLYQHRNAKKFLDAPDETLLRELLDEAELRCADLLAEED